MTPHRSSALETLLAEAGLTGRGGAGFSTATKVAVAATHGAGLIVNACDGELGAAKDAWVVAEHLAEVVEGARLVTDDGSRPTSYAAHRGSRTLAMLRGAGLPVLEVPRRYVSSEESSLVSLRHGGLARPMTKRAPFVLGGRDARGGRIPPTLVLNAETVWRVAQIASRGAAWFRSRGTAAEPGPRLVAVGGHVARPGVLETEAGVRVSELLRAADPMCGEDGSAATVLVGGLAGAFLTGEEAARVRWASRELVAYGAALGPGVIEVLDPGACPVAHVDRLLTYAAGESAGQCGPCMFGLPAIAADLADLVAGDRDALGRLRRRLPIIDGRGGCGHPDGTVALAASALSAVATRQPGHLEWHIGGRTCRPSATVPLGPAPAGSGP